ncbi:TetR/AcrR family transcriptional regulator [Noviherbaspirillum sp. 1P10PC]|uniref:TetR/AcrR family transcriptional regulator n=1 Tax=Noviherbaspirillum sp. 1P10PC TaxID=3132292 RepID=UPI0039A2512B
MAEPRGKGRIRLANEADILQAAEQVFARAGYAGATMAEIAERAGVPKSNLHYYFGTKREIYRAVLTHILALWLAPTDSIREDNDPAIALSDYIEAKMRLTATHPDASRVFANEVLHGATEIGDILRGELRALVARKAAVIERWIADGRMALVDPRHLFFTIWAATQTYADFEAQVCAVLDVGQLDAPQIGAATRHLKTLLLRGCGLA